MCPRDPAAPDANGSTCPGTGVTGRDRGHSDLVPLLRIGPLSVPSPAEVIGTGHAVLAWGGEVVDVAAALPTRVEALVSEVERLVGVLGQIAERAEGLVERCDVVVESAFEITTAAEGVVATSREITKGASEVVDSSREITTGATEVVELSRGITTGAQEVVESSRELTAGAGAVMEKAGETSDAAREMLELYQPMLQRGAPLAARFIDDLTETEVDAAVKLVDQLPVFTEHMTSDILPILETLDRVGPDLHELLDVTKDLRRAVDGIPGFSFLKRRGEAKEED